MKIPLCFLAPKGPVWGDMARVGLFVCVCVALCSVSAGTTVETVYFVVGKTLELRPPPGTQSISNVLWKHTENAGGTFLVAEWNQGEEVDYYPAFKDIAHLDTATGVLTVKPMPERGAGVYTVEVNQKMLDIDYRATMIQEVPTPKVWEKPGLSGDERNLSCTGDVSKAGPVTYWWNIHANRSWVQLSSDIILQRNDTTQRLEDFSCKMINPVGERESALYSNPFFRPAKGQSGLWPLVLLPILVGVAGFLAYYKRNDIREMCCSGGVSPTGEASGNGATSATPKPDNEMPLKSDEAQ